VRRVAAALAVGLAAACATGRRPAAADRLALVPAADRDLAERLVDAEQVVAGALLHVEEAVEYERPGSFVFGVGGEKASAALAYAGVLRVDSTLRGEPRRTVRIVFFAPRRAPIPQPDTTGIWILHRRTLWRLRECAERQSVTSTACPADQGLALDSNADVRPLAEWSRLRAILDALGLGTGPRAP
jgi:hypothetical protein